jgi:hypothetical protein
MKSTAAADNQPAAPSRSPAWGVGIGYRSCIHREVMSSAADIDFLEIPAEDYVDANRRRYADPEERCLKEAVRRFPVVGHGSDVSVGSAERPPQDYLHRVGRFARRVPIGEYSEHLTCTRAGAESVHSFIAIPFTDLGVAATAANAKRVAQTVGLPFLLENVCYHFEIPGSVMPEVEFIKRVVTEVDCGILLDITNVYINASNHHYDPNRFIRSLPSERILHSHYCGVLRQPDGYLLDTHSEITPPEVWALVDEALSCTALRALILERDSDFLPWDRTINEIRLARQIFLKHRPASPPSEIQSIAFKASPANGDRAPAPAADYSKDLALFQQVLMSILLSEDLARAVDREGESALRHTGLGGDERRLLASIPRHKRELVGSQIRQDRIIESQMREARRREEFAQWARIGP